MRTLYVIWWTQEECTIHKIAEYTDDDIHRLVALTDKCINIDDTDPDLTEWICTYLQDKPKVTSPLDINGRIFRIGFWL